MTLTEMKTERVNRGLSLRDAAAEIGVSYETLRQVEMGSRPSPSIGKLIADFYGVRVTDIWPLEAAA